MQVPFGSGNSDCGGNGCSGGGSGACRSGGGNGLPNPICTPPFKPGAGNCCLAGGQSIELANGDSKDASEITVGDEILGVCCCRELSPQRVVAVRQFEAECIRITHDLGEIVCTRTHLLLDASLSAVMACELTPGSQLIARDFNEVTILDVSVADVQKVFAWTCEPDHTFICDGIFHHNKPYPIDGDITL